MLILSNPCICGFLNRCTKSRGISDEALLQEIATVLGHTKSDLRITMSWSFRRDSRE